MSQKSVQIYRGTVEQFEEWATNRIVTTVEVWEHTFYVYKPKVWSGLLLWVLDEPLDIEEKAALNLAAEPTLVLPVTVYRRRKTDKPQDKPRHLQLVK